MADDAEISAPRAMRRPTKPAPTFDGTATRISAAPVEKTPDPEVGNWLAQDADPKAVILNDDQLTALYAAIEADIAAQKIDLSTDAGRKRVASFAYKIARTKTALDGAGKDLNAALREQIDKVDARRRTMRDTLDDMADKARRPLTDWEAAEKDRLEKRDLLERALRDNALRATDTAATLAQKLQNLSTFGVPDDDELGRALLELVADISLAHTNAERAEQQAEERRQEQQRLADAEAENERLRVAAAAAEEEKARSAEREARQAEETARQQEEQQRQAQLIEQKRQDVTTLLAASRLIINECLSSIDEATEEVCKGWLTTAADMREKAVSLASMEALELVDKFVYAVRTRWDLLKENAEREKQQANRQSLRTAARNGLVDLGVEKEVANKIIVAIERGEVPNIKPTY